MAVQSRANISTIPFIRNENSKVESGTIAQNEHRTTPLLPYTVVAKNATTREWVPFNTLNGTTGVSVPRGIYIGDEIPAADLVAGAIANAVILVGDAIVNRDMVVWDDDTLNENSIVNPTNIEARTAKDALAQAANIYFEDSDEISSYENA